MNATEARELYDTQVAGETDTYLEELEQKARAEIERRIREHDSLHGHRKVGDYPSARVHILTWRRDAGRIVAEKLRNDGYGVEIGYDSCGVYYGFGGWHMQIYLGGKVPTEEEKRKAWVPDPESVLTEMPAQPTFTPDDGGISIVPHWLRRACGDLWSWYEDKVGM